MTLINIEQNSPEWLEMRRTKIGASDIPIILGLSPYKTALELFREKLGFAESVYGPQMKFGHDTEEIIRRHAELENECMFPAAVYQHENYDWAIASLDGVCVSRNLIFEAKTTNYTSFSEIRVGVVRKDWYAQVQWQMFVSGFPKDLIYAFHKNDIVSVAVDYDSKFIESNFAKIMDFRNCLVTMTPPGECDRDYAYMGSDLFKEREAKYAALYREYDDVKKRLAQAKEELEEVAEGNCEGACVRMTKVKRKGSVDWSKLCEEERIVSEIVEEYRKPDTEYYKISLKE